MATVIRTLTCGILCILLVLASSAVARAASAASRPTATAQKTTSKAPGKKAKQTMKQPSRDIQGFRVGMGMKEAKQLLAKKKVPEYETGFSDLFVYAPADGAEIKLLFTCGAKEYILSNVELSTTFPVAEADRAISIYRDRLVAKYGPPVRSDVGPGSLNLCWGQCERSGAWRLEARTTAPEKRRMQLVVSVSDESLVSACGELRRTKIDHWLNQWITDVQKFTPGMGLKTASSAYRKRFQDRLVVNEERDEGSGDYLLLSLVSVDHDYFTGLDYEALFFEGDGPGTVTLKFTADQAGKNSPLNRRLYYMVFSTAKFTDQHLYADMQAKLDRFVKAFGNPLETMKEQHRITARWVEGAKQRMVAIEDSGLISLEQSDLALKEAYRDAAVQQQNEQNRKRFDQDLF